jgi:hypothetical protein
MVPLWHRPVNGISVRHYCPTNEAANGEAGSRAGLMREIAPHRAIAPRPRLSPAGKFDESIPKRD